MHGVAIKGLELAQHVSKLHLDRTGGELGGSYGTQLRTFRI